MRTTARSRAGSREERTSAPPSVATTTRAPSPTTGSICCSSGKGKKDPKDCKDRKDEPPSPSPSLQSFSAFHGAGSYAPSTTTFPNPKVAPVKAGETGCARRLQPPSGFHQLRPGKRENPPSRLTRRQRPSPAVAARK